MPRRSLKLKALREKRRYGKLSYKHSERAARMQCNWNMKTLAQLKEKWTSLVDKYKKIKDNNKATGRGRESFEFFEEL